MLLQKPSNVRDTKELEKLSLWDESLTSQKSETLQSGRWKSHTWMLNLRRRKIRGRRTEASRI